MADILDLQVGNKDDDSLEEGEIPDVPEVKEKRKTKRVVRLKKGRGFSSKRDEVMGYYEGLKAQTELESFDVPAQRSVDGWILIVTGIHEEAHEEDVLSKFSEYGDLKSCKLNIDRRTGFLKGYALLDRVRNYRIVSEKIR